MREHNDANVISLGAAVIGPDSACDLIDIFLKEEFDTTSTKNHFMRVEKIRQMEKIPFSSNL